MQIRSSLLVAALLQSCRAAYNLLDDYIGSNPSQFANQFDFFTDSDPTAGYVNYVSSQQAQQESLLGLVNNKQVYIGVDHTNNATGRGRDSVRISSKKSYNHGLIILDLAHMPGGQCGTWPAFWLLSSAATWPNGGEVDIIENINSATTNGFAMHTNSGCTVSNSGFSAQSTLTTPNCDVNAQGQAENQGCAISTNSTQTYGAGFNAAGGGVYATEWTSDAISIWSFPRTSIPSDITSGSPNPSGWGLPLAKFSGPNCNLDQHVFSQQIIFDITFCGSWAGQQGIWSADPVCSKKADTCQDYVQNNPSAFTDTYWLINGLKVYEQSSTSTSTSLPSTSTASAISSSSSVQTSSSSTTASTTPSLTSSATVVAPTSISVATTTSVSSPVTSTSSSKSSSQITVSAPATFVTVPVTTTLVISTSAISSSVTTVAPSSAISSVSLPPSATTTSVTTSSSITAPTTVSLTSTTPPPSQPSITSTTSITPLSISVSTITTIPTPSTSVTTSSLPTSTLTPSSSSESASSTNTNSAPSWNAWQPSMTLLTSTRSSAPPAAQTQSQSQPWSWPGQQQGPSNWGPPNNNNNNNNGPGEWPSSNWNGKPPSRLMRLVRL